MMLSYHSGARFHSVYKQLTSNDVAIAPCAFLFGIRVNFSMLKAPAYHSRHMMVDTSAVGG